MNMNAFKLTDEQIANVIVKATALVAEDARPVLVAHMYEMAWKYNENGNSSLFVSEVEKLVRKIVAVNNSQAN